MLKTAMFIDGGHVRALARQAGVAFDPDLIERLAHSCVVETEERLIRALYFDCAPYRGTAKLPVSGNERKFEGSDAWLNTLAGKDYFAVRLGRLKFRGFQPRGVLKSDEPITDDDFKPVFEQKGVDMRIGLDIVRYAAMKTVDRIILISGDTDCLPAMKRARIEGLQVVIVQLPKHRMSGELKVHADFTRTVSWPVS